MVDVFGRSRRFQGLRGPRGLRGIPGTPGSIKDMCTWMPQTVLKNLQLNDEQCCFVIEDPTKDIKCKGSDVEQWISRSHKKFNLTAERAASLEQLPNERYALVFKNSRYINDDIFLLPNHPGTYGFICLTFRTSDDQEQTIVSNYDVGEPHFHEIFATSTEIGILGMETGKTKRFIIQHSCRNWTTLFVEYAAGTYQTQGRYIINNDQKLTGDFTFDSIGDMDSGFSVGGRYDNTRFLQGEIASIEMYHVKAKKDTPPDCLKDLVIKNQLI